MSLLGTLEFCLNTGSRSPSWNCPCSNHTRGNTNAVFSGTSRYASFYCQQNVYYYISFLFFEELKQKYELASKGTAAEVKVDSDDHGEEGLHSVIGLALVLGFVFMLLIDQIGSAKSRGKFGSNSYPF